MISISTGLIAAILAAAPTLDTKPADAATTEAKPAEVKKPIAAKPPIVKLRQDEERIGYRVTIRPGVPEPGTPISIEVELSELLNTPDPVFGKRKPLEDGQLIAILVAQAEPEAKKVKKPAAPWAEARQAVKLSDAGLFGFTFTAEKAGVYGLYLKGSSATAGEIAYKAAIPVGVWPMPDGVSHANPPPLPPTEPTAQAGDRPHGRTLCEARCKTDVEGALPKGKTPTFLASSFALALSDDKLLAAMLKDGGSRLSPMERNDLLHYLHSLHWKITDFFPEAGGYIAQPFTINEHGRERLKESAKIELSEKEAHTTVFVAFNVEKKGKLPTLVDFSDRIGRDRLKAKFRLGYLVFLDMPKEPKAKELAIAMSREPVYAIDELRARDANGQQDEGFNKQLASFVGLGHFNDPQSLRKGAPALEKRLMPLYLTAAEYATMYYGAEREFAEFDAEFGEGEAASAEGGELKVKVSK